MRFCVFVVQKPRLFGVEKPQGEHFCFDFCVFVCVCLFQSMEWHQKSFRWIFPNWIIVHQQKMKIVQRRRVEQLFRQRFFLVLFSRSNVDSGSLSFSLGRRRRVSICCELYFDDCKYLLFRFSKFIVSFVSQGKSI